MQRNRVALLVYVDLMHTKESAEEIVAAILNEGISHYRPRVEIAQKELQPEERLSNTRTGYLKGHISDIEYIAIINQVNPED